MLYVWCEAELVVASIKDYELRVEQGISKDLDGVSFVRLQRAKAR